MSLSLLQPDQTHPGAASTPWPVSSERGPRAALPLRSRTPHVTTHDGEVRLQLERAARAAALIAHGRHAAAERLLREVAASLERRGAQALAADQWDRLGRLLLERARPAAADVCGQHAERLAAAADDAVRLFDARLLRAWTSAERLRLDEAICAATALSERAPDDRRRFWARALRRRVARAQGRETTDVPWPEVTVPAWGYWDAVSLDALAAAGLAAGGYRQSAVGRAVRLALDAVEAGTSALVKAVLQVAHLRVVAATGDRVLMDAALREVLAATRVARAPLRGVHARLVWHAALGERVPVRLEHAATPLARAEARGATDGRPSVAAGLGEGAALAVRVVELAQGGEDERAVHAVLTALLQSLGARRVSAFTRLGERPVALVSVGQGPMPQTVSTVLTTGATSTTPDGAELGVPVRRGDGVVGALVVSAGDTPAPAAWTSVVAVAAASLGVAIEGLQAERQRAVPEDCAVPELLGVSQVLADVRAAIARAAKAPFPVLIEGESGVGKELVARAVHRLSARQRFRFCDVNCAALPEDLVESELFGHVRGAFTGAVHDKAGLFEEADGGTLFLDEVADLSLRAQAKLLRALQQREVRRVGEARSRVVDARVVAAANRSMRAEVDAGRFRADLLYRLDVIHVRIPPLRERREDIPVLARAFWADAAARVGSGARLSTNLVATLARYDWPGNIRELQNVVAALAVAAPARGSVSPALLPRDIGQTGGSVHVRAPLLEARAACERRTIQEALACAGDNRTRAARSLGLSRQGLLKSMARLGLR